MKFIKIKNGLYIRTDQIIGAQVSKGRSDNIFEVQAKLVSGELLLLIAFSCDPKSTTQFDPKEAAQTWLDDFVAKLNEEMI